MMKGPIPSSKDSPHLISPHYFHKYYFLSKEKVPTPLMKNELLDSSIFFILHSIGSLYHLMTSRSRNCYGRKLCVGE
jgi:hypothetical protein